jgi:putative flavoprotein involved in K+ transport
MFVDVAIIGAGQAGLAMSQCLASLGVDHVIFERDEIAARWKTSGWDSLRLLTPNWMNVLPSLPYDGNDPNGFMPRSEFISRLENYAAKFNAPVYSNTAVQLVTQTGGRYQIATNQGTWVARAVVIATGYCDIPVIPAAAASLPGSVTSIHSSQYRRPGDLNKGNVLVVGASSSGLQIAQELRRSGRDVIISVGKHTRLPRSWRGNDIFWWFDRMGLLRQRTSEVADIDTAMRQPSLQLVGRPDHSDINLATLQTEGVRLAGRVCSLRGDEIAFSEDLPATIAAADAKQDRLVRSPIESEADFGERRRHLDRHLGNWFYPFLSLARSADRVADR